MPHIESSKFFDNIEKLFCKIVEGVTKIHSMNTIKWMFIKTAKMFEQLPFFQHLQR